jgi:hypothetical protein
MSVTFSAASSVVEVCKSRCVFLITLSTFFLTVNSTKAQKLEKKLSKDSNMLLKKFEVGIAGGVSLNYFNTGQPHTGLNTGYTGGISVKYDLFKGLGLQVEANYLQQGGQMIRFKDDTRLGLPENFESKNVKNSSFKLNSIEVPLLINYTFKLRQTWKPALYLGGSYAYTFNVTDNYQKTGDLLTGEDIISTVNGTQNSNDLFKSNRYTFIAGANVKLPLGSKLMILLDFRYLTGITVVRENYSYMEKIGFGSDVRTNSFISKIGVAIPLN